MLRRILKWAAIALVVLVATGAVLYAVGLRVVLYGGGAVRLAFVESESDRAARIARDREAQRARAPASLLRHHRSRPTLRRAGRDSTAAPQPAPGSDAPAAAPAVARRLLDGLPRPEPRRHVSGAADPHATGRPTG